MLELFRAGGPVMIPLALVSVGGWWLALSCWSRARCRNGRQDAARLGARLRMLGVFVAMLPLLGLLGTVTGMIDTFGIIRSDGLGDPRLLAGGIREALIATECGLAAALPLMLLHQAISARLRRAEVEAELGGGPHA